jgi:sigma-E factor negative regulatory protein RseC
MANGEQQVIRATVRALDGSYALVEAEGGGCGRCHEKGGCGGPQLSRMFCSSPKTYRVANEIGAREGEQVTVAIESGSVRQSANLAYVLPLTAAVAGAVAGMFAGGEPWAIIGAGAGLVLAFVHLWRRTRAATGFSAGNPHIVSRLS